jgi:hypothetical protein
MKVPRQAAAELIKAQSIALGHQEKIAVIELNAFYPPSISTGLGQILPETYYFGAEWHDPCRVLPHIIWYNGGTHRFMRRKYTDSLKGRGQRQGFAR